MTNFKNDTTIAAPATGEGGAVAIIRISGRDAFAACDRLFRHSGGKKIAAQPGYTLLFGNIVTEEGEPVDEVLVSVFRGPRSYTGEDMVEIGCHGSAYVKTEILRLLYAQGVEPAGAGEFTLRAFLNGKMDLSQAEAVADLISAEDRVGHRLAMKQLRGGYSDEFAALREKLLELAALLELELDFGEEDVEFADRTQLRRIIGEILARTQKYRDSFRLGNVLKNGIPVAIAGPPNVGKSTLLNALVRDDRAMVSDIAGTTRDYIEEIVRIGDLRFRFIDTAGLRETEDRLEAMGIERSHAQIRQASVILLMGSADEPAEDFAARRKAIGTAGNTHLVAVVNKSDLLTSEKLERTVGRIREATGLPVFALSAKKGIGLPELTDYLAHLFEKGQEDSLIVTNTRHYQRLDEAGRSLRRAAEGLENGLSTELLAEEVRQAACALSAITGGISPDDVLGTVFSKFCIGK